MNIGVGTLATARRPAGVQLKSLLETLRRRRAATSGRSTGPVRAPASALLPMGGAVSGVAGRNWALIGDAAGCVNPLNGEGIDYGLETGRARRRPVRRARLVRGLAGDAAPALRRGVLHRPAAGRTAHRCRGSCPAAGPVGMRSRALMTVALRVMGNLVTDEDRDVVARAWRLAGRSSVRAVDEPVEAA